MQRSTKPFNEIERAIHVECAKEDMEKVKAIIVKHYSSIATEFPLCNEMRRMPLILNVSPNPKSHMELKTMANEQLSYNDNIVPIETCDLLSLEMIMEVPKKVPIGLTVREFLMNFVFIFQGSEFCHMICGIDPK